MSETEIVVPKVKRPRLQFIDMARSVAILLMLEGHFIDHTLGNEFRSPVGHFQDSHYVVYDIWHLIRGYTSPMFLTVTGMVFTYLLYMSHDKPFWSNDRIKKGGKRVLELLFWGYLLTPNGFHILQCIGFGILGLLTVFGLYKLTRVIPLWVYYLMISLLIFSAYTPVSSHIGPNGESLAWPIGAPQFIQNMFYSPGHTLFPFTPSLGYTFFGAFIGVTMHSVWINKRKWNIPLFLLILGIVFSQFATTILYFLLYKLKYIGIHIDYLARANWLFENLGWVLIVLGLLASLEKVVKIKDNLFIRIGQNTLSIFVIHMMILYGCLVPISIATFFGRNVNPLNPYEAAVGAALFLTTFILYIKYMVPLSFYFNKLLNFVFPIRKRYNKRFKE